MVYIFLLRSCTKVKEVFSVNKPIEEDSEDDLKDNMWLEMRRINNYVAAMTSSLKQISLMKRTWINSLRILKLVLEQEIL